jgi:hypothetical protein
VALEGDMTQAVDPRNRLAFLDNLRTAMIFLVVVYHCGIVYESSGLFASFWIVDDPATNDLAGLVNILIDIMVMPAIFFVSGFLAPVSLRHRTGLAFVAHRFRRLMVPWLIAVFTLVPAYKVIFLYSRHLPQEHWTTYFHFSNGALSQGWLWFLPVLFLFDTVFAIAAKAGIRPPAISLRLAVAVYFLAGVSYSLSLSLLGLTGWTKTPLVDFQNERLLAYFLVFLLGALCNKLHVFDSPPGSRRGYLLVSATAWVPISVYFVVLLSLLLRPGQYIVSLPVDLLVMWSAFYLSMLSLLYLLITTFRLWLNRQGTVGAWLSANAYAVYIIHVPILGVVALALLDTALPSLLKFAILTVGTYVLSNALVQGYRAGLKLRLPSWHAG